MEKFNKALVCGAARSGIGAAKLLKDMGIAVLVTDNQTTEKLAEQAKTLDELGISYRFGQNPDDILSDFDLMVLSPGLPLDLPFIERAKELGLKVIGEVELGYLASKAEFIAITGTNGKTTTTALTFELFRLAYPSAAVAGNIGIPVCEVTEASHIICEISSFQLESIDRFHPRISAVLNITPDHLNRHKTMENYTQIKEKIFMNQTKQDVLVLNYDNDTKLMANRSKAQVVFFSKTPVDEEQAVFAKDGIIVWKKGQDIIPILPVKDLKILGDHSLENALAGAAMALYGGVSPELVAKGLSEFTAVEHRIEHVATINGVKFYNDSKATNPDAAIKGLLAMDGPTLLIGGGRDKDSDYGPWVELFSGRVKKLITIGEAASKIENECDNKNFSDYERVNSLKAAVLRGFELAKEGDSVLLSPACASFDMFENYEQRGSLFKAFVRELEDGLCEKP